MKKDTPNYSTATDRQLQAIVNNERYAKPEHVDAAKAEIKKRKEESITYPRG